ncbi:MAG: flagellar M-ring protein FliF C-terminal domain-containing protein, partial [Myxococcota bacterium]
GTIQEVESIPAGEIRRINAAVSFNQEAVAELATRSGKSEDEIRASLQKLVETSLGTDKTRGDVVAVEFLPFPEMEDLEEGGGLSTMTYIVEGYLPSAIALLAVLLFFFMVARPIVTTITKISVPRPKDEKEEDSEDPANIPADTTDPDLLMERMRHLVDNFEAVDARDLNRLTQMHEDPAASVLRRWLKAS